jgi:endogenous inhibitor of DNA gyrase (YacG/DUF329 family)
MSTEQGGALCVLCRRRRVDPGWRPFCSERCKLQDLARWADGSYRLPGERVEEPEKIEEPEEGEDWPTR